MPTVEIRNMKTLGAVIRATRLTEEIAVPEFADSVNVTPQYLWQIESGASPLFITRIFRMLKRLNIKLMVVYPDARSPNE